LMPVHVEPYLIKVMIKAKEQLGPEHAALKTDIDLFIRQETQHYKVHQQFNKALYAAGYDRLPEFERELAGDYKRFLANRSLRFNCAYSEGFETLGPPNARAYFERYGDLLNGADAQAVDLWKWHMLEEYEHRDVAYRVYKALFGNKSWFNGYVYRIWGFFCAMKHLGSWGNRVTAYLIAKDREEMSAAQLSESLARERTYKRAIRKHYLPQLLRVLGPSYDPRLAWPEPRGMSEFMQRVEIQYAARASEAKPQPAAL
jgi:predicted metal-dependent hydrolase